MPLSAIMESYIKNKHITRAAAEALSFEDLKLIESDIAIKCINSGWLSIATILKLEDFQQKLFHCPLFEEKFKKGIITEEFMKMIKAIGVTQCNVLQSPAIHYAIDKGKLTIDEALLLSMGQLLTAEGKYCTKKDSAFSDYLFESKKSLWEPGSCSSIILSRTLTGKNAEIEKIEMYAEIEMRPKTEVSPKTETVYGKMSYDFSKIGNFSSKNIVVTETNEEPCCQFMSCK